MTRATLRPLFLRSPEECLFWWRAVIQSQTSEWSHGFALSIDCASKQRGWQPSAKQLQVMRQLVAALFVHPHQEPDDFTLIER